jgi:hypothetical protein
LFILNSLAPTPHSLRCISITVICTSDNDNHESLIIPVADFVRAHARGAPFDHLCLADDQLTLCGRDNNFALDIVSRAAFLLMNSSTRVESVIRHLQLRFLRSIKVTDRWPLGKAFWEELGASHECHTIILDDVHSITTFSLLHILLQQSPLDAGMLVHCFPTLKHLQLMHICFNDLRDADYMQLADALCEALCQRSERNCAITNVDVISPGSYPGLEAVLEQLHKIVPEFSYVN